MFSHDNMPNLGIYNAVVSLAIAKGFCVWMQDNIITYGGPITPDLQPMGNCVLLHNDDFEALRQALAQDGVMANRLN